MCEWGVNNPWEWGDAIAQSWRMNGDHTGIWSSTKEVIQSASKIPSKYSGRPYGWNDMDMLETGNYDQAARKYIYIYIYIIYIYTYIPIYIFPFFLYIYEDTY